MAVDAEVEKCWLEFWAPIVAKNGALDVDQVKRELFDFKCVMDEVSEAYDDVTGGHISKPNTAARHVIDRVNERLEEAAAEALDDIRDVLCDECRQLVEPPAAEKEID